MKQIFTVFDNFQVGKATSQFAHWNNGGSWQYKDWNRLRFNFIWIFSVCCFRFIWNQQQILNPSTLSKVHSSWREKEGQLCRKDDDCNWLHKDLKVLPDSSASITISQHQSASIRISHYYSISITQYQSASTSINQHQSSSISINQHQSVSISINQHQSASVSINHNQSASISITQHQSA